MTPPPKTRRIRVEVKGALPGGPFQRVEGGWVLERPFRVHVQDSAVPSLIIVLDIEASGGRLLARSVYIERRKAPGRVDGTALRQLPIEQYLSHALKAAMGPPTAGGLPLVRPVVMQTATSVTTRLTGTVENFESLNAGQTRRRPGREAMERVVAAYKEALADPDTSRSPTETARKKTGYTHGHVSRLLTQARKEGLLGPARPGRPGEVINQRRTK